MIETVFLLDFFLTDSILSIARWRLADDKGCVLSSHL